MPDSLEDRARDFAIKAHGAQLYGDKPYSVHLVAVRDVVKSYNLPEYLRVSAWLHDVLEDTAVTADELEANFGALVKNMVWCVTGVGRTRKERNASVYAKLRRDPRAPVPDAAALKVCDRIVNLEKSAENAPRLFAMYLSEQAEFETAILASGLNRPDMMDRLRKAALL